MKTFKLFSAIAGLAILTLTLSCEDREDPCEINPANCEPDNEIVGQRGNPQFNLQFTNPNQVDLDLYVQAPNGEIVFFGNPFSSSGGQLDVDCLCGDCPNGPNENIFWPTNGSAPRGTYRYWIEYFEACNFGTGSSSYTVRVLENGSIKDTHTGNVSSGTSPVWTYTF